jgi:hypothetical protein
MWRRRLLRAATAASVLVVLLLLAVYARSSFVRDELTLVAGGRHVIVSTFPHHVYVIVLQVPPGHWKRVRVDYQYPGKPEYLEPRLSVRPGEWRVGVPFWLPLLFALALPAWQVGRWRHARRRDRQGRCSACGYDLRASGDRCPECGTPRPVGGTVAPA